MSMFKKTSVAVACGVALAFSATAFAHSNSGKLEFIANGEELAVKGFSAPNLTKDGWSIKFDHIYVGLADVTAYQVRGGYDAEKGGKVNAKTAVALPNRQVIDLVGGINKDDVVNLGSAYAPAGHYNAISWRVVKADSGPSKGHSIVFIGTANKGGKKVKFKLVSDEVATYRCGEYVGDARKGVLKGGSKAEMEMTFHVDHIFGNIALQSELPEMNKSAYGFNPFAGGGTQRVKIKGHHLGHAGEAHCNVQWH